MNILNTISKALSLTKTEVKVFLFLASVLLLGSAYKFIFKPQKSSGLKQFDYSLSDSVFNAAGILPEVTEISDKSQKDKVDYKEEDLDFNKTNFNESEPEALPAENSINLNTAELNQLSKLPGIGIKTAQNILDYRKKSGRFKSINELREVKGIGQSKLNKIKKYLYID